MAHSYTDAEIINWDAWRAKLGKHAGDQMVNGQVLQVAREQLRTELHVLWTRASELEKHECARDRQVGAALIADQLRMLEFPLEFPEVHEAYLLKIHT